MRDQRRLYTVLEHLFGGDMFIGTFKTIAWLIVAAVIFGVVHPYSNL